MILSHLSPLVNHLWQSTLCVAVVWLLTLVLRRNRASVRYWLWMGASLKFLVPLSLLVSAGHQLGWRAAPLVPAPRVALFIEGAGRPLTISAPPSRPPGEAPKRDATLPIAWSLWFCGFAAGLWCWYRSWQGVRAQRRAAAPVSSSLPVQVMSSPACLEPCLAGVLHPVLLIPEGLRTHLSPSQFEAILAHELCHARRRDNLTGAVHLTVETIFWFYPVLWWIRERLVAERERACDEEVLSRTGDPRTYAEGILRVCRFCLRSPLVSVSGTTGSHIKKRIATIIANPAAHRLDAGRKFLLAAAGSAAVVVPLAIGIAGSPATLAQSRAGAGARPGFEVASIKSSKPGSRNVSVLTDPNGRFTAENATLRMIVTFAFGVRDFQVTGGPSWIDTDRFDIVAKPDARSSRAQVTQMVETLLADRFQLRFHRETKERPVFALVVGKNGPKLKATEAGDDARRTQRGFEGGRGQLTGLGADMKAFAARLSGIVGRTVIDRTALTGRYDFQLQWTPDRPGPMRSPDEAIADNEHGASLFTAVQEQLGLRLESQRGPVEILVIDSVQKPSAN